MAPSLARRAVVAALVAGSALVAACGARGPLDTTVIEYVVADASPDVVVPEAGPDGAADAPQDAPPDVAEAAPEASSGPEAGPVACITCLEQTCGSQALACFESTACRTALQCAATMCFAGGAPSLTCIEGCTMGNTTTLEQLLALVACIVGPCGPDCAGGLGNLGGG